MTQIRIENLIIERFDAVLYDILDHGHTHYTFPGGRGSTKSSFIGRVIPLLVALHPFAHAVIFRRYANTMRDSVYAEIVTGISALGMDGLFKYTKAPMEITYKPTGQKIMFRGLDEPEKIKSIKMPFGYIAVTWWEELDQFPGRQAIDTAMRSTMRGGNVFWNFESFNPPITASNWANEDLLIDNPDRLITRSTYLDVPPEWLGERFIIEAEYLKSIDPRGYRHVYMGEAIGTGGNVFENIEARTLTDDFIKQCDRIYQGIDWGWYPDPFAFVRLHYDASKRTIFFLDELYGNKIGNDDIARWIRSRGYGRNMTICDNNEVKSIIDIRQQGVMADSVEKWNGSVDYGMKWLQRHKLVFDPKRTPNAYREFRLYEYERDKYGNVVTGYPDKDDHTISAARYAPDRLLRSSKTRA